MALTVRGDRAPAYYSLASERLVGRGLARLSSGLRVNSAADDAAGLVISERLKAMQHGSAVAARNAQDAISLLQVGEGALGSMTSMLQRARDLAVQAANTGSLAAEGRAAAAAEVRHLVAEIDRTVNSTTFNGLRLLDGSRAAGLRFQVGADVGDDLLVTIADRGAQALGLLGTAGVLAVASLSVPSTYETRSATQKEFDFVGKTQLIVNLDGVQAGEVTLPSLNYTTATGHAALEDELRRLFTEKGIGVTVSRTTTMGADPSKDASSFTFTSAGGGTQQVTFTGTAAGKLGVDGVAATLTTAGSTTAAVPGLPPTSALADLVAAGDAAALGVVDRALALVLGTRSDLGSTQNRLEHRLSVLASTGENLAAARSRIADADMAVEWLALVRGQLLGDTGRAVQAQGNASGQRVLQLLGSL